MHGYRLTTKYNKAPRRRALEFPSFDFCCFIAVIDHIANATIIKLLRFSYYRKELVNDLSYRLGFLLIARFSILFLYRAT
jgi:hypothetical protein